jgi:hypothetical protein
MRLEEVAEALRPVPSGLIAPPIRSQKLRPRGPASSAVLRSTSRSSIRAGAASSASRIRATQGSPSRQGVHQPQLSRA